MASLEQSGRVTQSGGLFLDPSFSEFFSECFRETAEQTVTEAGCLQPRQGGNGMIWGNIRKDRESREQV